MYPTSKVRISVLDRHTGEEKTHWTTFSEYVHLKKQGHLIVRLLG